MRDVTDLHPSMHGPVGRLRLEASRVVGQLHADVDQAPTPVEEQWRRIRFWAGRALVLTGLAMLLLPVILGYLAVLGPYARWVAGRWGLDW